MCGLFALLLGITVFPPSEAAKPLLLELPPPTGAERPLLGEIVYDDGGSHVLDQAVDEVVWVDESTTLTLIDGAELSPSINATALQGRGGATLILQGGWIEGTGGPMAAGGVFTESCQLEISGTVQIRAPYCEVNAGSSALYFLAGASGRSCRIDGGTIVGGGTPRDGSVGAYVRGDLQMSGGHIEGGAAASGIGGFALECIGGTVDISGGSVQGGEGIRRGGDALWIAQATATITGGSFTGGACTAGASGGHALLADEDTGIEILGGTFTGGASTGVPVSVLAISNAHLTIHGGSWEGAFMLTSRSLTTVMGYHLQLDESTALDGEKRLTGTLSDGTPIDVQVVLSDQARLQLVLLVESEEMSVGRWKGGYVPAP